MVYEWNFIFYSIQMGIVESLCTQRRLSNTLSTGILFPNVTNLKM